MYDTCPINIFDFRAYKICISSRKTFIWFSEGKQSRDDPEIALHILLVLLFFFKMQTSKSQVVAQKCFETPIKYL